MWQCIDDLDCEKGYLQIFKFTMSDEKQKVTHFQENPEYKTEYLLNADAPFFVGKIYVIDNGQYSTMLLADEY